MSKPKHTPGPWCYQKETTISVIGGSNTRRVRFEVYKMNGVYGHPATCDNEEDARLIASAPTMLDALQFVLDNHHEGYGEFEDIVIAAIEAATGEKP